jgi:predicted alpha/beta-fold hydrolase
MGGSLSLQNCRRSSGIASRRNKIGDQFSVPCDLKSSAEELNPEKFYQDHFLRRLGKKLKLKSAIYPGLISYEGFEKIRDFETFDNLCYLLPLHGFKDAHDFYEKPASSFISLLFVFKPFCSGRERSFITQACSPA